MRNKKKNLKFLRSIKHRHVHRFMNIDITVIRRGYKCNCWFFSCSRFGTVNTTEQPNVFEPFRLSCNIIIIVYNGFFRLRLQEKITYVKTVSLRWNRATAMCTTRTSILPRWPVLPAERSDRCTVLCRQFSSKNSEKILGRRLICYHSNH